MTAHRIYHFEGELAVPVPEPRDEPEPQPVVIEAAALSPEQVADYLGVSRSYAYKLMNRGELPWFRLGRLRKVLRSDADEFIRRLRDEAKIDPTQ